MTARHFAGATPTISRIKQVRTRLLDKLSPQRVVFHHVPKCGGTSVGAALRRRYFLSQATVRPEQSFLAYQAFTGRADREQLLVDVIGFRQQMMLYWLFEDVRCISLHVPFSNAAYERFGDRYTFITILREPVSRFISHYCWSYGRPDAHGRIEEPLGEFLDTPRAKRLGSTYVEYFCGFSPERDLSSDNAVDAAISNLRRFDVVGTLSKLDRFESDIATRLGIRLKIGHRNKSDRARTDVERRLTPEIRSQITELCAPDIAVWRACNGL
ncbi:MAG: sulfotransferase family 2 domain-containing protein [Thiohalocapsa sp.]|nr:sulfotransferase family 2 domain-containing protein [Thiohalocapsa sp.]